MAACGRRMLRHRSHGNVAAGYVSACAEADSHGDANHLNQGLIQDGSVVVVVHHGHHGVTNHRLVADNHRNDLRHDHEEVCHSMSRGID